MAQIPGEAAPVPGTVGGRGLLRVETRNASVPIERRPPWLKTRLQTGPNFIELKQIARENGLHTVCEEAACPNIYECWEAREATFLIGGDRCTRRCDFCLIDTGKPLELDRTEPESVAAAVKSMGLGYATITGVARDDLPDGGAWLYAETVRAIRRVNPRTKVEMLAPDFRSRAESLREVFDSHADVLGHNVEIVPRVFRRIRPGFSYDRSLHVLEDAHSAGLITKSNLILGLGETRSEVIEVMRDLRSVGCDLLTITQYLRPSPRHHPVARWTQPSDFVELKNEAAELGFTGVLSGPLVRSSTRRADCIGPHSMRVRLGATRKGRRRLLKRGPSLRRSWRLHGGDGQRKWIGRHRPVLAFPHTGAFSTDVGCRRAPRHRLLVENGSSINGSRRHSWPTLRTA